MPWKPGVGKVALVCGAGGFIAHHLVRRLKWEGFWVRGADLKYPRFSETQADDFLLGDLRDPYFVRHVIDRPFDEIYQLAADMGGAGYIFTGEHDADVMHNSATINLNIVQAAYARNNKRIFYSSSACIYPEYNQLDPDNPNCAESTPYPAAPDSEYGWEKLFSERLYLAYGRNHGMEVRIARYHNIFGPEGSWNDGKEKAPAAVCRKVAMASNGGEVEIWGDGKQTRSFLYVDECLDRGIHRHTETIGFVSRHPISQPLPRSKPSRLCGIPPPEPSPCHRSSSPPARKYCDIGRCVPPFRDCGHRRD